MLDIPNIAFGKKTFRKKTSLLRYVLAVAVAALEILSDRWALRNRESEVVDSKYQENEKEETEFGSGKISMVYNVEYGYI